MSNSQTFRSLEETTPPQQPHISPDRLTVVRGGFRMLLAVLSVLFALFAVAYGMRMHMGDWQTLIDPWQLWINTAMLFLGSGAMELARRKIRNHQFAMATGAMLAGGLFAGLFLYGQLWVWQLLYAQGLGVDANPASSFFYLFTGLHGLHIAVGLIFWLSGILQLRRQPQRAHINVELCCSYWHFLLVIWLGLFALLANT